MTYFNIYFDKDRLDNLVAEVLYYGPDRRRKVEHFSKVVILVPTETKYFGPKMQPKFVVFGKCQTFEVRGSRLYIT